MHQLQDMAAQSYVDDDMASRNLFIDCLYFNLLIALEILAINFPKCRLLRGQVGNLTQS